MEQGAVRPRKFRGVILGALLLGAAALSVESAGAQDAKSKPGVPVFQVDPSWPQLPEKFKFGMVTGVAVDAQDHVWVLHRQGTVKDREHAAPPAIEFDAAGKYIQGWGGPGEGYEWPLDQDEHGIFVDYQSNVWICAGGGPDKSENQILKFTKAGKFLLQIGHRGKSRGSNDVENLSNAADVYVYPKTNEVFVADGYLNRRVIVFDATTGAYKRYWGAYGNKPDDTSKLGADIQQFAMVHQIRIANDGLLYVAVLQQGRVQVFTVDGKYLKEIYLGKDTQPRSGATAIAFSRDPQQQFMYVNDFGKQVIHIFDRQTLEEVGSVGQPGTQDGEFKQPHHMVIDSKGNLYVSELGGRIQKFLYKGISRP
jgi:DNA-binding beta-propeller fold protein YncE